MSEQRVHLWVKVCGLCTVGVVEAAVAAGVDAVGFVFNARSPRNLAPQRAGELAAAVPGGIEKVAVFLHPTQHLLETAVEAVRPDWVQTDAHDLTTLRLPPGQRVLPVYRTGGMAPGDATGPGRYLFESGRSGAGERADWEEAARLSVRGDLVLAGGLDAANVAAAVAKVRPFGVDVSSGVESSRGVKDAALIRSFVDAARAGHARVVSSQGVLQR